MKYLFYIVAAILIMQFGGMALISTSIDGSSKTQKSNGKENAIYIRETKAAIVEKLKRDSLQIGERFEVDKIVFNSEKTKEVAGQQQVRLTFTYELKYDTDSGERAKNNNGSITLAKDDTQKWFYSSLEIDK